MKLEDYLHDDSQPWSASANGFRAVPAADFMALAFPPRNALVAPWLLKRSLNMVFAARGVGKTQFAMGLAYALASGQPFLGWEVPQAAKVLYLDGEMAGADMQTRWQLMGDMAQVGDNLYLANPDLQMGFIPDLATEAGRQDIEDLLASEQPHLLIIDNKSVFMRATKENEGDSWAPIQSWLLGLKSDGYSVLLVHHAGKNGMQRGSSRIEDCMDVILQLKYPADYVRGEDMGATFEIHFEKARHLYGANTKPLHVTLQPNATGTGCWTVKPAENPYQEAIQLLKEGISQKEITEILEVPKGTVSKWKQKAISEGLLETDT